MVGPQEARKALVLVDLNTHNLDDVIASFARREPMWDGAEPQSA